jgi:hypothetical protein
MLAELAVSDAEHDWDGFFVGFQPMRREVLEAIEAGPRRL